MFQTSVLYEANYNSTKDIVVNQGGSSSGKTYAILQVLFARAIQLKAEDRNNVITVVSESIPNLKAGALRDAQDIVSGSKILQSFIADYNKTDRVYTFTNGAVMEFKSFMTAQDAKSGKRKYLFINEANGINQDVFDQLHLRTANQTFIDYNPTAEFWVHETVIPDPKAQLIISDHRHNPFVPPKIRERIEGLRFKDMELFKVYARGLTGKIEGLVFRNWDTIEDVPYGSELIACWQDWGFTNDPSSFGKVFRWNQDIIIDELFYETGLTNSDIISRYKSLGITPQMPIVCDSAEPKSIEDLSRAGFNVEGAHKGPDSIKNSIDKLKQIPKIWITRRSVNTLKEFKNYKWASDSSGKPLNVPVDFMNHSIDGIRYVALNKFNTSTGHYHIV